MTKRIRCSSNKLLFPPLYRLSPYFAKWRSYLNGYLNRLSSSLISLLSFNISFFFQNMFNGFPIYLSHLRCSWSRIVFRDEKSNYQGVINLRNESFIRMIYTWFSKYKHNFMSFRSNIILIDRFIWIFLIRKMNERWKEFVTAIQFHCGFR